MAGVESAIVCERCRRNCEPLEDDWGLCHVCARYSRKRTFDDVKATYQDPEYTHHLGTLDYCKQQCSTNIDLLTKWKPQGRVLDIGFLNGATLLRLHEAGYAVRGFDVSEAARTLAQQNGCEPRWLEVGDFYHFGLFDFRFDAVVLREVIEHVPDPGQLLEEIRLSLFDDGILQVQTPRYDPDVRFWDDDAHLRCYTTGALTIELEDCGFDIIDLLQWQGGVCVTCRKTRV